MFDEQVVVHFLDGRLLPGYSDNFFPAENEIMVREAMSEEVVTVHLRQVKVVCFVRSLSSEGRDRNREPAPLLFQGVPGRRIELAFKDGEHMQGIATLHARPTQGFFVTPLNPRSNNVQVYVNPDALTSFRFLT
jgi:hypothetical protein